MPTHNNLEDYTQELLETLKDMLTACTAWWPKLNTDHPQKFRERIDKINRIEVINRAIDLVS